jgi:hypothetical protein
MSTDKVWVQTNSSSDGSNIALTQDALSCSLISGETLLSTNANATKTSCSSTTKSSGRVSTTISSNTSYSYMFDKGRIDKRVSLNVAPLVNGAADTGSSFAERVTYVLGQKKIPYTSVYGFLYGCLNKSCGLIFSYTPSISVSHTVNYESTDITHSNINALHYRNTQPPSFTINATFTADTRDNALHMLSAIWFLRAVTKCDFGESSSEGSNNYPGTPPPILYLNGYNQIMDNIPVVVEYFSYSLPEDKDYVQLGINLNTTGDNKFIYTGTNSGTTESGSTFLNGIKTALSNITGDSTTVVTNGNPNSNYYFSNWLPTEMKFTINLRVATNLLKYKKQFDLNKYKMGIYNLPNQKGDIYIASSSGTTCLNEYNLSTIASYMANEANKQVNDLPYEEPEYVGKLRDIAAVTKYTSSNQTTTDELDFAEKLSQNAYQLKQEVLSNELASQINSDVNKIASGIDTLSPKTYKFDKSGWTW